MNGAESVLEVIACTVADAVAAERGGAHRLEIVSDLASGGLTPPLDLVREIIRTVRLPVRVMLRENEGYQATGEAEVRRLCAAARRLAQLRIDGLVLGFSRGGEIDLELVERLLSCAPGVPATFHRAFEAVDDSVRAIHRLKTIKQIDRILTSGGSGDWPEKIARLASCEREARPRIRTLAGGGIDARAIQLIGAATTIREFHVGRAVRAPARADGAVQSGLVAEILRAINTACGDNVRSGIDRK